jgi:hypothetical protein
MSVGNFIWTSSHLVINKWRRSREGTVSIANSRELSNGIVGSGIQGRAKGIVVAWQLTESADANVGHVVYVISWLWCLCCGHR